MRTLPKTAVLAVACSLLLPLAARAGDGAGGAKPGTSAPAVEPAGQKDWTEHKGDIPFIIGREAGMKEAEFSGKPVLFFYTATW